MDRLATRTDPLSRQETYAYDNNGNLTTFVDRKGQTTLFTFDPLDRLTARTHQDTSTVTYGYDAGNRLTQLVDSIAGTMTLVYNGLDRIVSETTPNGTVTRSHDSIGRPLTVSVPGQAQINYSYDVANRLTSITQGIRVFTFDYDSINRRTTLSRSGGNTTEYSYDNASRLISLTQKHGAATLGTLIYGYDAIGKVTQIDGTWARTGLPAALSSATYNAANHQTAFGGTALSYDLNGNLTGIGEDTYAWNARNQLVSISGTVSRSFVYDALGRRQRKVVGSEATDFLYDGLNIVKATTGATAVDILAGFGVDEHLSRSDSTGTREFLLNSLGSIVALATEGGTVETEYTYEPFGTASVSGADSANELSYTGREDDGAALYYYRARYYHPTLQRFISEDPLQFAGRSMNLYGYVQNSPLDWVDPLGLLEEAPPSGGAGPSAAAAGTGGSSSGGAGRSSGHCSDTVARLLRDPIPVFFRLPDYYSASFFYGLGGSMTVDRSFRVYVAGGGGLRGQTVTAGWLVRSNYDQRSVNQLLQGLGFTGGGSVRGVGGVITAAGNCQAVELGYVSGAGGAITVGKEVTPWLERLLYP